MSKSIKRNWLEKNWFNHHLNKRRELFYKKNRWHFILDLSGGIIIVVLLVAIIALYFYRPYTSQTTSRSLPEKLELDLNNPPLVANFSVATSSFSLADGTELKINLNNGSNLEVKDIKISLLTTDSNFSINKINNAAEAGSSTGVEINNKQIIISSLATGEEKEIKVKVNFKSKDVADRIIKWQAQTEYSVKGQIIRESVNLLNVYLRAELNAQAAIYYNSPQGDQLGSGPLPPLVGLPTNYWIFFEVKSDGNFKNLVFSGKLSEGVGLTNKRSLLSGDFKYSTSSRQIIWTVPELKNQDDNYRVGFEVQFIPIDEQFDTVATILNNLKCYAYDNLTNQNDYVELNNLDSNLDYDQINKGNGKIGRP